MESPLASCARSAGMHENRRVACSGDPDDVGRFYDRHVDVLRDWFAPRVYDPDDVDDLVAETFARALVGHARATPVLEIAERELAAYQRRGDAARRMRRRLGIGEGDPREELVAAAARCLPRQALPSVRAVLAVVAAVVLAGILVVAFTGGRREEPPVAKRPVPTATGDRELFGGSLESGVRYRTRAFVPALSFEVADAEWTVPDASATASLVLARRNRIPGRAGSERRPTEFVSFTRSTHVYDPDTRGLTSSLVPAPFDLRAWLAEHPDLRVGPVEPVTVAGVPGEAFAVTVAFMTPVHRDPSCRLTSLRPCTAIAPGASFFNRTRMRAILLRIEPDPLLISLIAAPRGDLQELEVAAAPVLRSLRIGV
jgi:hypothetical protein